jgi:hypothetical protein
MKNKREEFEKELEKNVTERKEEKGRMDTEESEKGKCFDPPE